MVGAEQIKKLRKEVMYYDKDKELALGGNNHVQVHHKGKFTIVTAK